MLSLVHMLLVQAQSRETILALRQDMLVYMA